MPELMEANAVSLLKEDHRRMEELFARFEADIHMEERREVAKKAMDEIQQHSFVEEEVLYPQSRRAIGDADLVMEAQETHHVAKIVMAELRLMPMGPRFKAKFRTLAKIVREHIQEEESHLFPRLQGAGVDLEEMGRQMQDLRRRSRRFVAAAESRPMTATLIAAAAVCAIGGLWYAYRRRDLDASMLRPKPLARRVPIFGK